MTEPRSTVTSYVVSIWPEDCSCIDSAMYCCAVVDQGFGKWSVRRGTCTDKESNQPCLGTDGDWHYENLPSDRTREELAGHRFDVVTALGLARKMAPGTWRTSRSRWRSCRSWRPPSWSMSRVGMGRNVPPDTRISRRAATSFPNLATMTTRAVEIV